MSVEGFRPVPLEEFRGFVNVQGADTADRLETPFPFASYAQNCDFAPGRVFKRPGLTTWATLADTGYGILSLARIDLSNFDSDLLAVTGKGNVYRVTGGIPSTVAEQVATANANTFAVIDQMYDRLWIALGNQGFTGVEMPLHYSVRRLWLDQVAPEGPAEAPTASQGAAGTLAMPAGTYKVRVFFRTRSGHWTAPSPAASVTITAGTSINVSSIPIGPAYVTERTVCFTTVDDTNYFFIPGDIDAGPNHEIPDNTTTTLTGVEFTTAQLIAGTPVSSDTNTDEDQMRQIELPPQAGVVVYHNRMVWWGGQNNVQVNGDDGFRNLSFNGGFSTNRPLGWTEVASGGAKTTSTGSTGDVFAITGDGTNQKGRIQNNSNVFNSFIHREPLKAYVRAKLGGAGLVAGTFHVFWTGTGAPGTAADFNVTALSATEWRWVSADLLSEANNKPGTDWKLNFTTGGTGYGGTALTSGQTLLIDRINIVYSNEETQNSLVRWSKVDNPEAYDGLTGIMNVSENDEQPIRAAFVLRDNLYFAKPSSLSMTRDNSTTEPNEWAVDMVSNGAGAYNPRCVAVGDGWAVLYGRSGIHFFDGGAPVSIADEIRPSIPAYTLFTIDVADAWIEMDTRNKRIWVAIPTGASSMRILYCKYEGATPAEGKRDWSIWEMSLGADASARDFRAGLVTDLASTGGKALFMCGGSTPKILLLNSSATNDLNAAITSYYQTGYVGRTSQRNLIGYVTLNVRGTGVLDWYWVNPAGTLTALPAITMSNPFTRDVEQITRIVGERNAFRFGTDAVNETWSMQKFVPYITSKTGAPVRGVRG